MIVQPQTFAERRRWLRAALAAALAPALPGWSAAQPVLTADPFTLGIASGSPTADGVVLWTRLTADALGDPAGLPAVPFGVVWELAEDDAFRRIVQRGEAQALPELAHSVHVEVGGLAPAREYHYRFRVGGRGNDWTSPTGRTRTLPGPGTPAGRLRIAYASCQRWEHGHYAAWRHLVADAPDAVLFLGDYIYEYAGAGNAVRLHGQGWVTGLDDYRRRYALHRSDPALRAAHEAAAWFVIWDDHEVQNDYAGLSPGDSGPPVRDFAARRAAAYQAFYEHMPLRASVLPRLWGATGTDGEVRIHGGVSLGRLGRLLLLDARQYRSVQACTRGGRPGSSLVDPSACSAWSDPARTMLGADQERWFESALAGASEGGWCLIGQTTLFAPRDHRPGAGESYWNDGWDGYPAARARLLDSLRRQRVADPVFLGGDIHENWVGQVHADLRDTRSASLGTEFCGTSISSRSNGAPRLAERLAENPHFVFADAERRGYGLVDLEASRLQATLRVVDDVTRADSGASTLARFEVRAGTRRVERI